MAFDTIFFPVLSAEQAAGTFPLAKTLSDTFGSHLAARYVHAPVPPTIAYGASPTSPLSLTAYIDAYKKIQAELAADLSERFEALCTASGLPVLPPGDTEAGRSCASWSVVDTDPLFGLPAEARVADLTIFPCLSQGSTPQDEERFGRVLMRSRCPILVSGPSASEALPRKAVIAWNAGAEAGAAVTAALPLLAKAEEVVILTVGELDFDLPSADRLRIRLARAGVTARVEETFDNGPDGAVFLAHSDSADADLIVMGAYSRPRIAEAVFGGFTKHVLRNAGCALLCAQ